MRDLPYFLVANPVGDVGGLGAALGLIGAGLAFTGVLMLHARRTRG